MGLKVKFVFLSKNIFFKKLINGNTFRKSGINFSGKKSVRFRGFTLKHKKRTVDFFRAFWHVKAFILNFEYDPKKKTLINLLLYTNGIFSYVISIEGSYIGMFLQSGIFVRLSIFNNTIIKRIKKGTKICCLENNLFFGSKLLRSSSSFGKILHKNKNFCIIKLKSKKNKKFNSFSTATLGSVLNFNFYLNKYKKAGFNRSKGFKSHVRGVAMNPIDHPHGGGEGKKSKKVKPYSPWGKILIKKK